MTPEAPDPDPIELQFGSLFSWVPSARRILTAGLALARQPNRCICDRCRGKGFDRFTQNRSSRQCPKCRGAGSTVVGSTKR